MRTRFLVGTLFLAIPALAAAGQGGAGGAITQGHAQGASPGGQHDPKAPDQAQKEVEEVAARKLQLALRLVEDSHKAVQRDEARKLRDRAISALNDIVRDYPTTKAGQEARDWLDKLRQ